MRPLRLCDKLLEKGGLQTGVIVFADTSAIG